MNSIGKFCAPATEELGVQSQEKSKSCNGDGAADYALSVSEIARLWKTRRERVRALIESGDLRAFDLSPSGPRRSYRISRAALVAFESRLPPEPQKNRRRRKPSEVKEFF